jgi:ComF family protein
MFAIASFLPAASRAANGVLAVLLAPRCAACEALLAAPLDGPVCAECWERIVPITPPVCDACGDPLPSWKADGSVDGRCPQCQRMRRAIDRGRAIGEYAGALRAIVHALKYDGRTSVAAGLGAMMRTRGAAVLEGADAVVPVPLHRRRAHARGFNQAALLGRELGLPVWPLLARIRDTVPQVDLPEAERQTNVRDAFALSAASSRITCRAAVLVLVDDVSTTGATLEACARVLKETAGAREVRALTAARAVRKRP